MSLSDHSRRAVLTGVALTLGLAGCGFSPALVHDGATADMLRRITVDTPDSRNDYLYLSRLEERIGRNPAGDLTLGYALDFSRRAQGILSDQTTSRFMITGVATYALRDSATGRVVTSGKVSAFAGFSATGSTVATVAAETDAFERLTTQLADLTVTRLMVAPLP